MSIQQHNGRVRPALITGGAGFIGTNVATRLLEMGDDVMIYDNFSRPGVERNFNQLKSAYPGQLQLIDADVRDFGKLSSAVNACSQIFHFAAQVAVTTSLQDPFEDFSINAQGTLNLLEAVRASGRRIPLLYTSTNKVYGNLDDIELATSGGRYSPSNEETAERGISERRCIEFHSPYGCSKGAAEQYVLDYSRTYGMPTVVFRMSCIYGPHQCGTEDQGWVVHFLSKAIRGETITLYGDGRQVRDILFASDLVDAMLLAHENIDQLSGLVFNIGGGPKNTISLLELVELIERIQRRRVRLKFADWRLADQRYYVSDIDRFSDATGWQPGISVPVGIRLTYQWLIESAGIRPSQPLRGRSRATTCER